MATEKTILSVDLYDNLLTEKQGDYSGRIRITGTARNKEIAQRIVDKRTEYRLETIENILNMADQEKRAALAEGKSVVDGIGQYMLNVGGAFDGKKQEYKSENNKIGVTYTPSNPMLKLLDNIYINADIATVGSMIESFTDSTTQKKNSQITPGAPAIVTGSNILVKGDDPANGFYFTPEAGGEPVKVPMIVTNTKSQAVITIPQLADGQYRLSITTQMGSNYKLVKEPRTYIFPIILTVGEIDDPDDDRPVIE